MIELKLTNEEEEIVLLVFKQNKDKFVALLNAGVFDIKSGKAEINIHNNQIQSIYVYQMTYKRKQYEAN